MRKLILLIGCLIAVGCATDPGMQAQPVAAPVAPVAQTPRPATQANQPPPPVAQTAKPAAPVASTPVVFSDLPTFDRELAKSMAGAKAPVTVTSADRILLQKMPPRLEKWLAAVDDSGGRIETQSVDQGAVQTRAIGLIFGIISAVRAAREFARDNVYADARKYDAKIFYRTDPGGDRVIERVEWVPRQH